MSAEHCYVLWCFPFTRVHPHVPLRHHQVGAVKKCILMILNGEDMSKLLMTVIRFCITVEDHELKKLLVYFWECVKKYDASGHLKPEMILVWYVPWCARVYMYGSVRRSAGATLS